MLINQPPADKLVATLILAHGAGAPMDSGFMSQISELLAARGVRVIRFEFPYMAMRREDGRKRPPNPQQQLLEHWRAVYQQLAPTLEQDKPLLIGGKSMGGRMASLIADELAPAGLVCLGYPFHAAGKPEKLRVEHLLGLETAALIVQGDRDALGNRQRVEAFELSPRLRMHWLNSGDHDFKPLKSAATSPQALLIEAADAVSRFARSLC